MIQYKNYVYYEWSNIMKRVLLVSQNFYPEIGSGANRYKNIFTLLNQSGIETDIITSDPSYPNAKMYKTDRYWNDNYINHHKNKVFRIKTILDKQSKSHLKRIFYYIEIMQKTFHFVKNNANHYDTIVVTSPNIFMPIAIVSLRRKLQSEIILDIRDLWPDSIYALNVRWINAFSPILNYLERFIYNRSDKIVYNHLGFEAHIRNKVKDTTKPMLYLPNSINQNELDSLKDIDKKSEFTVFYSGNLGFAQNADELLEIAQKLNELKIKFDVIVYGLHAKEFKQTVQLMALDYVNIYDTLPRLACLKFMKARHVSLSLLIEDDIFMNILPGKIVDSISLGIPVITNVGSDAQGMINQHQLGFAKEKVSVDEIIDNILILKDDSEEYQKYSQNCERFTIKHFVWDNNITSLIKFIYVK